MNAKEALKIAKTVKTNFEQEETKRKLQEDREEKQYAEKHFQETLNFIESEISNAAKHGSTNISWNCTENRWLNSMLFEALVNQGYEVREDIHWIDDYEIDGRSFRISWEKE